MIGGVAGGVGDYLNIDPLLIRVAFAGLMIFGGAGLVLYVAAWVLIPADGRNDSIAENALGRVGRRIGTVGQAILLVVGVVLVASYLNRYGGWFTGDAPFVTRDAVVLAVTLVVVGVVILRWREGPRRPRAAGAAPQPIASRPTESIAVQPAAWTDELAADVVVGRKPRDRSPLGWYIAAAALGSVGILAIVANLSGLAVSLGQFFGAVLIVLGLGLIVGAWWGRARLLIPLGVLLLPIALTATFINVPLNGGIAEQVFRPATIGEIRSEYRLAGGEIQLDLTDLPAGGEPIAINSSVAVGVIRVTIPADARLELNARVGGGRLSLFGNQQTGSGLADRVDRLEGPGRRFVMTLDIGIGAVVVDTVPRNGG